MHYISLSHPVISPSLARPAEAAVQMLRAQVLLGCTSLISLAAATAPVQRCYAPTLMDGVEMSKTLSKYVWTTHESKGTVHAGEKLARIVPGTCSGSACCCYGFEVYQLLHRQGIQRTYTSAHILSRVCACVCFVSSGQRVPEVEDAFGNLIRGRL